MKGYVVIRRFTLPIRLIPDETAREVLSRAFAYRLKGKHQTAEILEEGARFLCTPKEFAGYLLLVMQELYDSEDLEILRLITRFAQHIGKYGHSKFAVIDTLVSRGNAYWRCGDIQAAIVTFTSVVRIAQRTRAHSTMDEVIGYLNAIDDGRPAPNEPLFLAA